VNDGVGELVLQCLIFAVLQSYVRFIYHTYVLNCTGCMDRVATD
jgi:hypothetical protein